MAIPSLETRRQLAEHDRRWHVKAVLRVLATVLAFFGMIMFAVAINITDRYFPMPKGDWLDGLPLACVSSTPLDWVVAFRARPQTASKRDTSHPYPTPNPSTA